MQKTHTRQCPGTPSACTPKEAPPTEAPEGTGNGGTTTVIQQTGDGGGGIRDEVLGGIIVEAICAVAGAFWGLCRQGLFSRCFPPRATVDQPMTNIPAGGNINVQVGNPVDPQSSQTLQAFAPRVGPSGLMPVPDFAGSAQTLFKSVLRMEMASGGGGNHEHVFSWHLAGEKLTGRCTFSVAVY